MMEEIEAWKKGIQLEISEAAFNLYVNCIVNLYVVIT